MKSERRHELRHNELADWLAGIVEAVRPYSIAILGVVLLGVLSIGVYAWQTRVSATDTANAWDAFYAAFASGDPANFEKNVIEKRAPAQVTHWARVVAADVYLAEACQELYDNKALAYDQLDKAREHYATVLKESRVSGLRERATFGLARTYETLAATGQSQGELDKARENYQNLVKSWPKGAYTTVAAQRLEALEKQEIKAFYDKLASYDAQAAAAPQDSSSGRAPLTMESDLPEGGTPPILVQPSDRSGTSEEGGQPGDDAPPPAVSGGSADPPSPTSP